MAAYGGGLLDEGELEDALEKAFNDGEVGDLNDLVCDDDQISDEAAANFGGSDTSVDCSVEDDSFECTVSEEDQEDVVLKGSVEDDKACDVVLEFNGEEFPPGGN